MKGKKILTLILAVVLAAGMLTACVNVPGSSAGVRLDTSTIEQMLENQGVTATVTADAGLTEAVDTVAASLALYNLKELDSLDIGAMVARQAGVTPLSCEVYGDFYWVSTPLGYASRRERTASSLIGKLGDGSYHVAAAVFVEQGGQRQILFAVTAA